MIINMDRLKKNILQIGEVGKVEGGGITRLAFSKEYNKAAKLLADLMEKADMKVKIDSLGNVIGKRNGKNNNLPSIMIGSHLDTVKNGGMFDGNLGIISGLEAVHYLNENNVLLNHPIEIIAFNGEEGSEMGGTFCSRVMVGLQDIHEDGLKNKLQKYGLTIDDVEKSIRDPREIEFFLELHIEQGANLYNKTIPVGIVKGIVGITRYKITVKGEANHAGTTPMKYRKDAMIGASKLIVEIDRIVKEIGEPLVATVGVIKAYPGAVNVIPGSVEFTLELRDLNQKNIDLAVEKLRVIAKKIEDIEYEFSLDIKKSATELNEEVLKSIEKSCMELNIPHEFMVSGAGHDANAIGKRVKTGMIFVPSKDGRSHCPEEWTDWKDIEKGMQVLIKTIINIDKVRIM